ncbi:hypothetical protein PMAYCL1PPCAC_01051, partial [Pristionchus mayeri]
QGDDNYEPLANFDATPPPPPGAGGADNMYEGLGGPGPDAGAGTVPPLPPPPPPPPKLTQSEKKKVVPIRDDDGVDLDSNKYRNPTVFQEHTTKSTYKAKSEKCDSSMVPYPTVSTP